MFPDKGKKRRALVYITVDGGISIGYGAETADPKQSPPAVVASAFPDLHQVLAEVLLDATRETQAVFAGSITDMRPWKQ